MAKTAEMYSLTVLQSRCPKLRYQQEGFLLRAVREGFTPGFSPWLIDAPSSPCVSSHDLPLSLSHVQISPFNEDISPVELEPILMTSS